MCHQSRQSDFDASYCTLQTSTQCLPCVYTTASSSTYTYSKKRGAEWLDRSNMTRVVGHKSRRYTQTDLLCIIAMLSTTFSQSFRLISAIFHQISSFQYLLVTGLRIDIQKSTYPVYDADITHIYIYYCFSTYSKTYQSISFGFSDT